MILIAGPTASGKSALAIRLAQACGGVVVNADALQVYDGLSILTARPTEREMGDVPHHLFGHVDPTRAYSVGDWQRDVDDLLQRLPVGTIPVFCGGTGLYFRSLTNGLDDLPTIPNHVRTYWRERAESETASALHHELLQRDPTAATRIRPTDRQRIVRALELIETSGKPLSELQRSTGTGRFSLGKARAIVLAPPREELRARIAQRFALMMKEGALQEALDFTARHGNEAPLASKAIGLRELVMAAEGRTTLQIAIEQAITRSRQYAKRQETWFRNQFGREWKRYASGLDVSVD